MRIKRSTVAIVQMLFAVELSWIRGAMKMEFLAYRSVYEFMRDSERFSLYGLGVPPDRSEGGYSAGNGCEVRRGSSDARRV
jgi:hypothetical protein